MSDEEPDVAESCSCVPNAILPRISLFTRRECVRNNVPAPDGWIRFGTVKHLVMYPVDGGTGFESDSVICTRDGPEFNTHNPYVRNIKDRRLVVYKAEPNVFEVCLEPATNIINCTLYQLLYGDAEDFENDNRIVRLIDIEKRYNGKNIIMQRRTGMRDVLKLQKLYTGKHRFYRIGYFSAQRRRELNGAIRFTNENRSILGLLPNYSHYTLINNKSLQCLKSNFQNYMKDKRINRDANQVSYLNFFPHIVIEGDSCSEFQEDFVTRVKIGNVEFGEILPCIHDVNVNFNRTNSNKGFERLHEYLTRKYAGRNINIQRRTGLLENRDLQMLYRNKNRYYRADYFPSQRRRLLNSEVRCTNENTNISGLHPNYSHFTLISNSSLQYLKDSYKNDTKNEDANQISYLNFFLHIVLEGNSCSPYQEEFVTRVKIGNVQFSEILSCVYNDNVNFNRTNPKKNLEDLHRYLMKSLPVSETYAAELNHYNSDMPAFGINMEKLATGLPDDDDTNRIRINDTVYVKF